MSPPPTTPAQRIDALRKVLSGEMDANRTAIYPNENYMLGVAFHAIVRWSNGHALTEIERIMFELLVSGAADTNEIRQYGDLYSSAKINGISSGNSIFPDTMLQLGDDEPVTLQHVVEATKATILEVMGQPNNKTQPLESFLGGCFDSTAYTEAVARAGRGSAALYADGTPENLTPRANAAADVGSGSESAQEGGSIAASSARIRLVLSRFKCHQKSGELGKDEIYWGLASGADTGSKLTANQVTREYGSIRKGDVRTFDPNTILFDGTVENTVAVHIQCWEADHSSSAWHDQLRKALSEASLATANWTAQWGELGHLIPLIPGAGEIDTFMFWTSQITGLIAAFLDKFRNHDDLVCERSIVFTRKALNWFLEFPNSEASFMFDGGKGGIHELWIRRELGLDPNDDTIGRLKTKTSRASYTDVGSSPSAPGPARSFWGVSLVEYNGELWSFFARSHNAQVCYSVWDGHAWGPIIPIGTNFSNAKPVAATLGHTVHVLYKGVDGRIFHLEYLPGSDSWKPAVAVGAGDTYTDFSPTIAGYDSQLIAVHRGDHLVYYSRQLPGQSWSGWTKLEVEGESTAVFQLAPALLVYQSQLFLIAPMRDGRWCLSPVLHRTNGTLYLRQAAIRRNNELQLSGSAVVVDNTRDFHCFERRILGNKPSMYMSSLFRRDNGDWDGQQITLEQVKAVGDPGACYYQAKIWLAYSDVES